MATVLAFDIGLKRTGVASGQSHTQSASPLTSIAVSRGRHDWNALDALMQDWQPTTIVIGQPNSNDDALNKAINRFKAHIQQHHKLPIVEVDETLTTHSANQEMAGYSLSVDEKKKRRDQVAACLILESYLDQNSSQKPTGG